MHNNSLFKKKILQFIDKQGISKAQFYRTTGITRSTLDKETGLSEENLSKFFASYPEVSLDWLLTDSGDMIKSDLSEVREESHVYKLRTDKILEHQSIPLYEIESTLGIMPVFNNINNQKPIDHLYIPNAPKCDGAIYATGDSMYPLIKSGDIQAFKIITDYENDIFWGEKYIISIDISGDEFLTTKFVQRSDKGDEYIKIVSQNKNHQDKDVRIDKIRAMALVKMVVRYETSM